MYLHKIDKFFKIVAAIIAGLLLAGSTVAFAEPAGAPVAKDCQWYDIGCNLYPYEVGKGVRLQAVECPPSMPKYCVESNLCYENWVDCSTLQWCKDNYYGCDTGRQLICVNGDSPLCYDECVDPATVSWCGDGYYGCWQVGCKYADASQFNCADGQTFCCPTDYPKYVNGECWAADWECKVDTDCPSIYDCVNHKCELQPSYTDPVSIECSIIEYSSCDTSSATAKSQTSITEIGLDSWYKIWCYVEDGASTPIDGAVVQLWVGDAPAYSDYGFTSTGWISFPTVEPGDLLCYQTKAVGQYLYKMRFSGVIKDSDALTPASTTNTLQIITDAPPCVSGDRKCESDTPWAKIYDCVGGVWVVHDTYSTCDVECLLDSDCASGQCDIDGAWNCIDAPPPPPPGNFIDAIINAIRGFFCQVLGWFC